MRNLRHTNVCGLPIQFIIVVSISIAITVFLGGWAANTSVEARADRLAFGTGSALSTNRSGKSLPVISPYKQQPENVENRLWESTALLICPLH